MSGLYRVDLVVRHSFLSRSTAPINYRHGVVAGAAGFLRSNMSKPDLTTFPCPCGQAAREVINAESNYRRGWYCSGCGEFHKAYGRERIVEVKNERSR